MLAAAEQCGQGGVEAGDRRVVQARCGQTVAGGGGPVVEAGAGDGGRLGATGSSTRAVSTAIGTGHHSHGWASR